jgi:hypothetical protein
MTSRPGWAAVAAAGLLGALVGFAIDARVGVEEFKVATFWGGLMWPLLLVSPLVTRWAMRRAGIRMTVSLAAGAILALFPSALRATHGFSPDELVWPLVMIGLMAACLSPVCVMLRGRMIRGAARQ